MKKTLQIFNAIAFVVTIAINYLSTTGIFNGETMASVSAKYQNLFTPAGYAFSIWGVIYLSLAAFIFYQARSLFKKSSNDSLVMEIGWWFIISCIANSLWVLFWLYGYIGLNVLVMLILLFSLFKIIVSTGIALRKVSLLERVCLWAPFSLYAGWVSVALLANITAYFTKLQWAGFGIYNVSGALIVLIFATAIQVFVTWKRHMPLFSVAGIWALVAIGVANKDNEPIIMQSALLSVGILLVNLLLHSYYKRPKRILEKEHH